MIREAVEMPPGNTRFQRVITRGLCGEQWPSVETIKSSWATAAFTNYVPEAIGKAARIRPGSAHWEKAKSEWRVLLERVSPRNVIVLGYTMWAQLPKPDKASPDGTKVFVLNDGADVVCWKTWHPAGGLSWRELKDVIRRAEEGYEAISNGRSIGSGLVDKARLPLDTDM